eukprot:TRINITY_DN6028_c0_g1_i1.p1 TRINITY_DN6028_c0_g1~~TRINITY_DN6028_c0_g1_i1.p1  ORF type:complete len:351 (+),score=32.73 TRINITY_DN6028_c0_g1_i1:78-1130(+)
MKRRREDSPTVFSYLTNLFTGDTTQSSSPSGKSPAPKRRRTQANLISSSPSPYKPRKSRLSKPTTSTTTDTPSTSFWSFTTLFSPVFNLFSSNSSNKNKLTATSSGNGSSKSTAVNPYSANLKVPQTYHREETRDETPEVVEEFDPYLFIRNLPPRPKLHMSCVLPPKPHNSPKITLVLDLDETLVHASTEPLEDADITFSVTYNTIKYTVFVRKRPHVDEFLQFVAKHFEVVIFTASQQIYAETLLDKLDLDNDLIQYRLYRDSCICIDGNYLKDLNVLGRDLSKVVIIDNSPQAFGYQLENGIPVETWFDNEKDTELRDLVPLLLRLKKAEDVRPLLRKEYELYKRIY